MVARAICTSATRCMALITSADEHRRRFKSRAGLDLSETARNISFCAHCMLSDEPFVVLDALADPRFLGNPLVTGAPNVRFCAGAPVEICGFRSGFFAILGCAGRSRRCEAIMQGSAAVAERELE